MLRVFLFNFENQSCFNPVPMKKILLIITAVATITACKSKKPVLDPDTLPKDVALKPVRENGSDDENYLAKEAEDLRKILASIDTLATSKVCTDTEEWRITPIGSKPCGGPASYMAYHKDVEEVIIPKIQEYTRRQAVYNQKAGIFSDCMIEPQPSGMRCEAGKPVLLHNAQLSED